MPLHEDLERLGATLFVKRTKVLYVSIALMLFGALGMGIQASETANAVGSVAPALSDACKDYKFHTEHLDACGTANQITATPAPTNGNQQIAPGSTAVIAEVGPLALGTTR